MAATDQRCGQCDYDLAGRPALYCPSCGHQLRPVEQQQVDQTPAPVVAAVEPVSPGDPRLRNRRLLQGGAVVALVIVALVSINSMSSDEGDPSDERGPSSTISMRSDEGGGGADQEYEAEPTLVSTELVLRVPSRCDVNCQSNPSFFPPTAARCEVIGYYSDGSQRSMGWQQC